MHPASPLIFILRPLGRLSSKIFSDIGGCPFHNKKPGGDLLSHAVTSTVPSALEGLTTLFGMGRGVAPPVEPPGKTDSKFYKEKKQTESSSRTAY